jgi:hypothetical protein
MQMRPNFLAPNLACAYQPRTHALSDAIAHSLAGAEGFLVLRLFKPLPHTGNAVQLSGVQGTLPSSL